MITTGQGLRVSSSGSNYVQPGAAMGMVRYNPSYNRLEIWDGTTWSGLATHHIDFDPQVVEVLEWARTRMEEDRRLERLCEEHPGLAEAHERFQIMKKLVEKEHA